METKETLGIDCMAGFKHNNTYRLGKVVAVEGDMVKIKLYRGTVNGVWGPALLPNGSCLAYTINKNDILEGHIFMLTKSGRLPAAKRNIIKALL